MEQVVAILAIVAVQKNARLRHVGLHLIVEAAVRVLKVNTAPWMVALLRVWTIASLVVITIPFRRPELACIRAS